MSKGRSIDLRAKIKSFAIFLRNIKYNNKQGDGNGRYNLE